MAKIIPYLHKILLRIILVLLVLSFAQISFAQNHWMIGAGAGTSWANFHKTYIVYQDPQQQESGSYIFTPAENQFSGSVHLSYDINLAKTKYHFIPELQLNYLAGNVTLTEIETTQSDTSTVFSKKLQQDLRLEVPLMFKYRTVDGFSILVGPVFYTKLYANNAFEELANELVPQAQFKSLHNSGFRGRIAVNNTFNDKFIVEIRYDFDLETNYPLEYVDGVYQTVIPMQALTIHFKLVLQ